MFLHRSDQPMNIHASQGIRLREAFDIRCRGGWAFLWWVSPYPLRLSGAALRGRIWWSLEKGTRTCDIGTGFQVDFGDQGFLPIQIGSGAPAPQPGHPVATFGFLDFGICILWRVHRLGLVYNVRIWRNCYGGKWFWWNSFDPSKDDLVVYQQKVSLVFRSGLLRKSLTWLPVWSSTPLGQHSPSSSFITRSFVSTMRRDWSSWLNS